MLKSKKLLVEHFVVNFIPVIIMTVLASVFLWRSFVMLESRNASVIRGQIENVMEDVEKELLTVMDVAGRISSDPLLNKNKLVDYGVSTLEGIKQIRLYEMQLPYNASAFVSYWPERIISGAGTFKIENFLDKELNLNDQSKADFKAFSEVANLKNSIILRRKDGDGYLLFLNHYPQSLYVDEKWVGVLFETGYIEEEFNRYLQGMDGVLLLYWKGKQFGRLNCTDNALSQEELETIYGQLESGEEVNGYMTMHLSSDQMDFQIKVGISNDDLRKELVEEMVRMAFTGIVCFIILSVFLWFYNHYRYVMMKNIKQLISSNYPEMEVHSDENDYVIIQKVLKQDFETLSRRNEAIKRFEQEGKRQLSWLLLNSSLPYDCSIEEILSRYDMEWEGPYCCVIEFLLDSREMPKWEDRAVEGVDIILSYETRIDDGVLLMICVNLHDRDEECTERIKMIDLIRKKLLEQGFPCIKVGCGLVYDSLSEVYSSQQEAYTLIKDSISQGSSEDVLFFFRQTKMAGRVPSITSDLLKQFRDFVQEGNRQEVLRVFDALMRLPEDLAEELLVYVRYKIVYILIEWARDMELDNDVILGIVELGDLAGRVFRDEVCSVLEKLIPEEKEKIGINDIVAFIEARYADADMSVDMISAHFNINERSIRRIMKKGLNKTYKEFLNEVRIKHACELLLQTDWTVRMISSQTGFFHTNTFYRVFRQVMGMSPDEYRASGKEEKPEIEA